jgi:predicted nucleotidyltransferase
MEPIEGSSGPILEALRAHELELRRAGIRGISLFGSDAHNDIDVNLATEIEPESGLGLPGLVALERRLATILGRRVDLVPEPVENARLQSTIDRDRQRAF